MNLSDIKQIGIIGVGFMGGSLALDLKDKLPNIKVVGYARNDKSYNKLKKLDILDRVDMDFKKVVDKSDVVVLALPVYTVIDYFKIITPFLKDRTIILDLGSSKKLIEEASRNYLPKNADFVGCHPLCGGEKNGAEFSHKNLYKGATCVITSLPSKNSTRFVKKLWEKLGAKVIYLSPSSHDKILSSVSHLPHLISFALTNFIPYKYLKFSLPSLLDMTRISNSPPSIWGDIFLSNKENILEDVDGYIKVMMKLRDGIAKSDKKAIFGIIRKSNIKQCLLRKFSQTLDTSTSLSVNGERPKGVLSLSKDVVEPLITQIK